MCKLWIFQISLQLEFQLIANQIRTLNEADSFRAPILGVGGDHGIRLVPEQMKKISSDAKGAIISNCGHLVPEEQPQELVKAMQAFWRTI